MNDRTYFIISGVVFGLVGVLHLLRLIFQWSFQIGPLALPGWISWGGVIAAFLLSFWGFRLSLQN